ncbi:MAG: hypothetical protein AB1776_04290 [Bacillota bacterium]
MQAARAEKGTFGNLKPLPELRPALRSVPPLPDGFANPLVRVDILTGAVLVHRLREHWRAERVTTQRGE